MSAVLGIFNLDGKPVGSDVLERMMKPMAHWGPDGKGTWHEGPVGLGHLMLHNTPESLYEKLPLKSRCGNYVITSSARIDNRQELLKTFTIPAAEHAVTPDSTLILEAYKKWGEECPHHLLGDWVFAIRDARERKLFIARDHHGNTGLYYYRCRNFLGFSSSLKGLLALETVPKMPNRQIIARILVAWNDQGDRTVYKDIRRLPPAHWMAVGPGNDIRVQRYWYLENTPNIRLNSESEYVGKFLEIYTAAVRCRLRSHRSIGILLSGGLDSGSVAAAAARELKQHGQRLEAFSSVPLYKTDAPGNRNRNRFGDERPFIQETARYAGNIDVSYITAEGISPLEGIIKSLHLFDQPLHAVVNQYWIISLLEAAKEKSISTLLTGQGGNAGISWHGRNILVSMALEGRFLNLAKELYDWKSARNRSMGSAVRGLVIAPIIRRIKSTLNRYIPFRKGPWAPYSAINPDFAKSLKLLKQMYQAGHDPFFALKISSKKARLDSIKPGRTISGAFSYESGAEFAMETRDPTIDKRVLEYCLGIPDHLFFSGGTDRLLIRRAMEELLPPKVRWNSRKGVQSSDLGLRLLNTLPEIHRALQEIEKSELARLYLDIPKIKNSLSLLQQNPEGVGANQWGTTLLSGIGVGLFLSRFR